MLSLRERPALVVGGGEVALRKIEGLLEAGARITVVAPEFLPAIEELEGRGRVRLERRPYRAGDLAGFALVFATTDARTTNGQVFADAKQAGIWVNVADDPELCTFHLPARVQRGSLQIAIASAGGAPFVVRRLRQLLSRRLGQEWGAWIDAAARFRRAVRALALPRAEAERRYDAFFAATVDGERLRARVPRSEELSDWLAPAASAPSRAPPQNGNGAAPSTPEPPADAPPALVSLVGAGPGDPGLLTVRARQRLLAAHAVVYDRLAATALPAEMGAQVELHCVGKEAGHHSVPQEEINALLLRLAREGKRTVRLKGGDPLVFGRGSEEAEALRAAGVPCEIVPGITAAIGVPAYAGIPPTHRGESVRLTLVTAHESAKSQGPQVRWDLLARDPHSTLVGYMGVANLPEVARKLVAAGMASDTPAALIAQGTTARQQRVVSTLGELDAAGRAAGIRPPAIFVIGPTVRRVSTLDWFMTRPLFGERLGLFAPGTALGPALDVAGAELVEAPRPLTPAARVALGAAPLTGWLFRDAGEVDSLEEERGARGFGAQVRAVCLGPRAAERARERGWPVVELAEAAPAEAVIAALAPDGHDAAHRGDSLTRSEPCRTRGPSTQPRSAW